MRWCAERGLEIEVIEAIFPIRCKYLKGLVFFGADLPRFKQQVGFLTFDLQPFFFKVSLDFFIAFDNFRLIAAVPIDRVGVGLGL